MKRLCYLLKTSYLQYLSKNLRNWACVLLGEWNEFIDVLGNLVFRLIDNGASPVESIRSELTHPLECSNRAVQVWHSTSRMSRKSSRPSVKSVRVSFKIIA